VSDPLRPGIATRVRARFRGESNAAALEALRSAGAGVYEALAEVDEACVQLRLSGRDMWNAPRALRGQLVATWNAYVLQTLGAGLLDHDYASDSGTVGYVPPATFAQAWAWFSAAAGWLSQAQQAAANPDFDLAATVRLPAALPDWVDGNPCPAPHLRAMLRALPSIRERAELAVWDLDRQASTDNHRHAVNRMRQLCAEAVGCVEYAEAVSATPAGEQLAGLVETHLKRATRLWFHIGQMAAMPAAIGGYHARPNLAKLDPETLPGGTRFDPWCLTDPATLDKWQADPKACAAIDAMWADDPDPVRTLTIHAQIQAALRSGSIVRVKEMRLGSYYYCCPWSPIYQVRQRVRIDGRRLAVPQQFTLDVSGEQIASGGQFVRRILLGPFNPTEEVDYCTSVED
jgi:hypothetical protein